MLIQNKEPGISLAKEGSTSEAELESLHAVKYEFSDDGEIIETRVGRCYPTEVQKMVAESLLKLLMAQIAHDGSWRLVWTEPSIKPAWDASMGIFRPRLPTVLQCQYLDRDGDVWTVVNIEEETHNIIEAGLSCWVEKCEEAYQWVWNFRSKVMDIRQGKDTICRAKGEAPTPTNGFEPPPTKL